MDETPEKLFHDNANNPWPPSAQKKFAKSGRRMREAVEQKTFEALFRKYALEEIAGWTTLGGPPIWMRRARVEFD